jgi:hypothetical protein
MQLSNIEKLFSAALAIESESAVDAGELGFTARSLTLCTMPHSKPKGNEFRRKNGNYLLTMYSPHGLPYGVVPRLLLAWITTEAVRTKSPALTLGQSQMKRLFSTYVSCTYNDSHQDADTGFKIVQKSNTWWHPQQADQAGLWESTLTLSAEFYAEVIKSPIPIDLRALKSLKRSPMALDLYMWLTFRSSYLKVSTVITWEQLEMQFGAEYERTLDFKKAFKLALRKVQIVYSGANVAAIDTGIKLAPGPTSIPSKSKTLLTG